MAGERRAHAGGRDRQLGEADAERVLQGVRDRGGDGDDARLAEPLGAERALRVHRLDEAHDDLGHVGGFENRVVHEALRQDLALLDHQLLGERVTEPHVDAAVHLTFRGAGVERGADVVRLACVPTSHGRTLVSELTTSTRSSGTPSVSATIIARTVSDPWPISLAPVSSATLPKSSSLTIAPQPSER